MKVELFYTPGCAACTAANADLRCAAKQAVEDLEWHEVNVAENIDRAVELGVLTMPAIAIEGELVFTSMPSAAQLRDALTKRLKGAA